MRKWLFSIIQKVWAVEIAEYVASFQRAHYQTYSKVAANEAVRMNYPIGQRVFLRSNEPDPLVVAEVIDHWIHENSQQVYPVLRDLATGKIYHTNNTQLHYFEEAKAEALAKLDWAEQWNAMNLFYTIDKEHQLRREAAYRAERKGLFKLPK